MVTMVTIDMVWISLLRQLLIIIWKRLFRRVKTRFQKGTFSPIIDGLALDFCDLHNVSLGGKVGISCILISDGWLPDWVKRILNHFWRTAGIWYPPKLIRGLFQIYEQRKEDSASSQNEDWRWDDMISKPNFSWKMSNEFVYGCHIVLSSVKMSR